MLLSRSQNQMYINRINFGSVGVAVCRSPALPSYSRNQRSVRLTSMAEMLKGMHELLSVDEKWGTRPRTTPWHLENVRRMAYLRTRRLLDEKWNNLIQGVLRRFERNQWVLVLLQRARPPAELPLADAIHKDVAQFLSISDDWLDDMTTPLMPPPNSLPESPATGSSSRMPTASSGDWEIVGAGASSPLSRLDCSPEVLEALGLCYKIFLDEANMPPELQILRRMPPTPKKAPPPPPPKALPRYMGPPPKDPPQPKTPPNPPPKPPPQPKTPTRPPPKAAPESVVRSWKKKAAREVCCQNCGHKNLLHQFM